jgi:hypothetical protein
LKVMDDDEDLIRRLHTLGTQPLEPALSAQTLAAIRDAQRASIRRGTRFKVALAAMVGFFAGGLGLASAGALPADVQEAAQTVLEHVGVDVPGGYERYNDPAVCPGGPYRNHGDYVRRHPDDPNAGESPCGKPVVSVDASHRKDGPHEKTDVPQDTNREGKGRDNGKARNEGTTDATSGAPDATEPAETESSDTESSSASDEQSTSSPTDQSTDSSS